MSNMSYCRFQNTDMDLADCQRALKGLANGEETKLSRDELAAAKRMAVRCLEIIEFLDEQSGGDILMRLAEDRETEDSITDTVDDINENSEDGE